MRVLLLMLCGTALLLAGTATAGSVQVKATLQAGALTVKAPDAAAQAGRSVRVALTIHDGRGSGAGWTLALANPEDFTVTEITAECATNSTCTLPRSAGGGVLRAARDSGMGVMQLVVTIAPLRSGSASMPLAFSLS